MYKYFITKSFILIMYFTFCSIQFINVNAFLDSDLGLDLYKNIDEGIYDLEMKNYEYEVTSGGKYTIKERLDKIIGDNSCISDSILLSDIEKIAVDGDIVTLSKIINDDCKNDGGKSINNNILETYERIILNFYKDIKKQAEEKADTTYKVSRIGLYSDGDTNNSPFDLIKDIEDINTIIFASENKYEGVEKNNNGNPMNNFMAGVGTDGKTNFLPFTPTKLIPYSGGIITPINESAISNLLNKNGNLTNSYICIDNSTTSGLDNNVISNLIGTVDPTSNNIIGGINSGSTSTGSLSNSGKLSPLLSSYKKVNDNSLWKCDSFFCIVIEFVTYNHKLLGGGKNISIESILAKSNEHIHKYTNTSSLQKQMTTNNWELSLKNLDLGSIFNLNFIIYKKSPPILNIDKKEKQEETIDKNSPLAWENQAIEYYKSVGLDYKRANSIQNIEKRIEELKCTQDSAELTVIEAENKCTQYRNKIAETIEENMKFTKAINELVKKGDLTTFHDMFVELQVFTKSFEDYMNGTRSQILKMDKKPSK